MYAPLERVLGVDLLLVLCWEEVDSVPSSTLVEQLSSSSCFIHLCIKITIFVLIFRIDQFLIWISFEKQTLPLTQVNTFKVIQDKNCMVEFYIL